MITKRLKLSLELLKPSDWRKFEELASEFLAAEFDDLRTTAAASGDEGRDSELFSPATEPKIVLQYSVAGNWEQKIRATVRRLKKTHPQVLSLIYLSSQEIGAGADALKRALRQEGLSLDVRDRNWFVERVLGSAARERAAEELAQAIVDPLLASKGVRDFIPAELSSPELVAAVTFLGLQWHDDMREKGLTKLAFEALVQSTLADTDGENRLPRAKIHKKIYELLPDHPQGDVAQLIDSALLRLTKKAIRHWKKEDEFCLTHEEAQRVKEFKTSAALSDTALLAAIRKTVQAMLRANDISVDCEDSLTICLRSATEAVLLGRSQAFAMAVQTGSLSALADTDFDSVLPSELNKANLPKLPKVDWIAILRAGIREILASDDPAIISHMRSLADAYTLLAFLRQTPDVQGAVEKMFSNGMLWLDATVVLPLIAETLMEADEPGRFTRMIDAARDAGLQLFITPGVLEEVERHMNRSLTCANMEHDKWEGSVPYLLDRFASSGRSVFSFGSWLENFRGDARPIVDLAEYLREEFSIKERSLEQERDASPEELRYALEQIWDEAHRRRRERFGVGLDDSTIAKLVGHDVECYSGVTQLRRAEHSSPFGYSAWWLTVDRQAFDLKEKLRQRMTSSPPDSPVMSADFMVNYLAFGPVRRKVGRTKESNLPLLMAFSATRSVTPEILDQAEKLRSEIKDLPDRVARRRVRDYLDRARRRVGPIANAGMSDEKRGNSRSPM